MAKFKYKYERLLALREIEEKKEMAELIKIRSNIDKKNIEKQEKIDEIKSVEDKIASLKIFKVNDMLYYSNYINTLEDELTVIENQLLELKKNEKEQQFKVVEISKKKKILEKLKEKHKISFEKEENIKINKFMDELGTQKFTRKSVF